MTHSRSVATVYLYPEIEDHDAFDMFLEDVQENVIPEIAPSMHACDRWEERECHFIAENCHASVSVSEYCGCVAIELVPMEDAYGAVTPLSANWCDRIANKFERKIKEMFSSCAMESMGRASNGEQFFRPIMQKESVVTSKEGKLW